MKAGLIAALLLAVAALLANLLLADPGYAALRWGGYLVEMSVPVFAVLLVAAYGVVRGVVRLIRIRQSLRAAGLEKRRDRARRSLARGILELSEGLWANAEETLTSSALDSEYPQAHYLGAARAAELLGASERRDRWIDKALEVAPDSRAPALITQAEMYLKRNQLKPALEALEQLETSGAQTARGLLLLGRIYRQMGDWQKLRALEPRLRSMRGIPVQFIDETVVQIYLDMLKAAGTSGDARQLDEIWQEVPKSLLLKAQIVTAYARSAMLLKQPDRAEKVLRGSIERTWDEEAVLAYGELETADPLATLDTAEKWLPDHMEDPTLLLACARLCIRAELYGKARSYLETSVAIRPRLEAYQLLASMAEQLGEHDRAYRALNDALIHAIGRKANLPKVRARRALERRHAERRH